MERPLLEQTHSFYEIALPGAGRSRYGEDFEVSDIWTLNR